MLSVVVNVLQTRSSHQCIWKPCCLWLTWRHRIYSSQAEQATVLLRRFTNGWLSSSTFYGRITIRFCRPVSSLSVISKFLERLFVVNYVQSTSPVRSSWYCWHWHSIATSTSFVRWWCATVVSVLPGWSSAELTLSMSAAASIICYVPQDSVLGLILFLMYTACLVGLKSATASLRIMWNIES